MSKKIDPAPKEWDVQKSAMRLYASVGCVVYSTSQFHNRNTVSPGIPDLIVFQPVLKKIWFHEVKRPDGILIEDGSEHWRKPPENKLSEAQREFQQLCAETKIKMLVGGLEVAEEFLSGLSLIKVLGPRKHIIIKNALQKA